MPTVPSNVVALNAPQARPKIDETFLMMAASDLHDAGHLFEDRAIPTQAAIASGTMGGIGPNATDFKGKP